jgi:hypothetical protein
MIRVSKCLEEGIASQKKAKRVKKKKKKEKKKIKKISSL